MFGDAPEEQLVAHLAGVAREERQVADSRLDQVLEEVGAERQVGDVVALLRGDLHQHGGVADVRVGDADAQLDVAAAAPAPGAHQDELALREELVQPADGAPDVLHLVEALEPVVLLGIHVDDVRDVGDAAVRHVAVRREQHAFERQVARDRRRDGVPREALRAALQQVQVAAVGRELDVHRRPDALAQQLEQRPHLGHERRVADQTVEGHDGVRLGRIPAEPDRAVDALAVVHRRDLVERGVLAPVLREAARPRPPFRSAASRC